MKKFLIKFNVWVGNELSVAKMEVEANSKKEAEDKFFKQKHVFPIKVEELIKT
jgi:hypothetical protein